MEDNPIDISYQIIKFEELKAGDFIVGSKFSKKFVGTIKAKETDSEIVDILIQTHAKEVFKSSNKNGDNNYSLHINNIISILPSPRAWDCSRYRQFLFDGPICLE